MGGKGKSILAVFLLGMAGVAFWFLSDKSTQKPVSKEIAGIPYKRFFQIAKSELTWILPEVELRLVKICQGELGDEFGYVRPVPKTIVFVKSTKGKPSIITARIKNISQNARWPRDIQSQKASDLNHFLIENSGVLAEHGSFEEIQEIDHVKGTRRFEALMEEALWLCTAEMDEDWDRRDPAMAELREEILKEASAYITIEWPMDQDEISMEVFYEVEGRVFKADFLSEMFRT